MINKFKVIEVVTHADVERYGVREFAAEFGHTPIGLPLLLFFCDEDLVAYVEVRYTPVLYPAVHPKVSPRIFLEGGRLLHKIAERDFENAFVIYDHRSANFKPQAMEHLGFTESPLKFFEPKE
jgi:hypothetical protein